jgi:hypothetical protein
LVHVIKAMFCRATSCHGTLYIYALFVCLQGKYIKAWITKILRQNVESKNGMLQNVDIKNFLPKPNLSWPNLTRTNLILRGYPFNTCGGQHLYPCGIRWWILGLGHCFVAPRKEIKSTFSWSRFFFAVLWFSRVTSVGWAPPFMNDLNN